MERQERYHEYVLRMLREERERKDFELYFESTLKQIKERELYNGDNK